MNCWRWIYRKLSEEQSHDISQKETTEQKLVGKQDSKRDARRRAFLQHAPVVSLMQLSCEASRESNQKARQQFWSWPPCRYPYPWQWQWSKLPQSEKVHQQCGKIWMPHVPTKCSELAHLSQDYTDNYDNWWDNINLHGLNIPDSPPRPNPYLMAI